MTEQAPVIDWTKVQPGLRELLAEILDALPEGGVLTREQLLRIAAMKLETDRYRSELWEVLGLGD